MSVRARSVVLDLNVLPSRPLVAEIREFLDKTVNIDFQVVKALQLNNINNRIIIVLETEEQAEEFVIKNNLVHSMTVGDRLFKIPVYPDDDGVDVRIHDIPMWFSRKFISKHMEKEYGEVLGTREEKWKNYFPGMPNGKVVCRMKLRNHVPSYITIGKYRTLVTYDANQIITCKHCDDPIHPDFKCAKKTTPPATSKCNSEVIDVENKKDKPMEQRADIVFDQQNYPALSETEERQKPKRQRRKKVNRPASVSSCETINGSSNTHQNPTEDESEQCLEPDSLSIVESTSSDDGPPQPPTITNGRIPYSDIMKYLKEVEIRYKHV